MTERGNAGWLAVATFLVTSLLGIGAYSQKNEELANAKVTLRTTQEQLNVSKENLKDTRLSLKSR